MGEQQFVNAEDERQYRKQAEKALAEKPEGFDLRTQIKHPRSGEVLREQYYRHYVTGQERLKLFERPVGSGNLWYGDGKPAGQMEMKDGKPMKDAQGNPKFKLGAPHAAWTPPVAGDAKLIQDLNAAQAENERLRQELAAIEAEKKAKK